MDPTIIFIETQSRQQRLVLCRWVEHCYVQGNRVQIVTDSTPAAQNLDQMLWTFSDLSFVPHRIVAPEAETLPMEPVAITLAEQPLAGFDTLACDSSPGLGFLRHFRQALHFVIMDEPERRQASRLLYQQARDAGLAPRHYRQGQGPGAGD